ncbi:UDP-galactose 4-epimerase, partial [Operophtera brumata]
MSETGDNSKPRVAVLGGCGFIGRNLVEYLITNDLVSGLRVVDKTPPQLAFLNPTHTKVFEDPRVEYKSANLINPKTRVGQSEAVYAEGILTLSTNVAKQCAQQGARLVEISSGQMYSTDKPHKEDGPVDPWTIEGRMKSKVEKELKSLEPELNYTIIRPAIVYGVGDRRSLTPRLLYGGIYKHLNEVMKLLWTADLKMNTVHVRDLCRAVWALGTSPRANRQTYNVVDSANSTQGSLAEMVAQIFGIQLDYYGTALSTIAKLWTLGTSPRANRQTYNVVAIANSTQGSLAEMVAQIFDIQLDYYGTALSRTLGTSPRANRQMYNVVDSANSTQGSLAEMVAQIFDIQLDYYGTALSTIAK